MQLVADVSEMKGIKVHRREMVRKMILGMAEAMQHIAKGEDGLKTLSCVPTRVRDGGNIDDEDHGYYSSNLPLCVSRCPPCVTFRLVVAPLRGPGRSPVLNSLCMSRRVAAFCRLLRPVLLLVSFPRSRSPVVGVLGLCWMWQGVPFARQRRPIIGVLRMCWLLPGLFDCFCCPHTSVHRPSIACLAVFLCFCEAQVPCSSTRCPGRPPYALFSRPPPPPSS